MLRSPPFSGKYRPSCLLSRLWLARLGLAARKRATARGSAILNVAALACIALLVSSCAAIQARQKSIQDARSACSQLNPGDVYQEAFGVIASSFPIARESERRGFIETEFTNTTDAFGTQQQKRVNVEVMSLSLHRRPSLSRHLWQIPLVAKVDCVTAMAPAMEI